MARSRPRRRPVLITRVQAATFSVALLASKVWQRSWSPAKSAAAGRADIRLARNAAPASKARASAPRVGPTTAGMKRRELRAYIEAPRMSAQTAREIRAGAAPRVKRPAAL